MLAPHAGLDVLGISRVADEETHQMLPHLRFSTQGLEVSISSSWTVKSKCLKYKV